MSRCARILLTSAFVVLCVQAGLAAEPATQEARVGDRGDLFVADSSQGPWRLVNQSDLLPANGWLRTGAGSPSQVSLPGATLHIGPSSRVRLQVEAPSVDIERGVAALSVEGETRVTLRAGARRVIVAPGGLVEFNVGRDGAAAAHVVRGQATLRQAEGQRPQEIEGAASIVWKVANREPAVGELAESEARRIAAWTTARDPALGVGQLLITDPQSGSVQRLNVARYHANVVLQPPVALVQLDQGFHNPFSTVQEGTFVFNLPHGASVSRFAMFVTAERLVEGELIDRTRANQIYDSIVHRRRDPAILEKIGDNLFRMRVFPIAGGEVKRILLDFTVPLAPTGDHYRFRLPLLSDLEPIWDFRLQGAILPPGKGDVVPADGAASNSHSELSFSPRVDGAVTFAFERQEYQPQTDFLLDFKAPAADRISVRSYLAPPSGVDLTIPSVEPDADNAFLYFVASLPAPQDVQDPGPADVLVLADTSSGVTDRAGMRAAVREIAGNLRPVDRLRLGCVDVAFRPLGDEWLAPDSPEADAVLDRLEQELFLGHTNLSGSLAGALNAFSSDDRRRVVIYVGDGWHSESPAPNETLEADMVSLFRQAGATFSAVQVEKDARSGAPGGWASWEGRLANTTMRGGPGLLYGAAQRTGGHWFGVSQPDFHRKLIPWLLAGLPPTSLGARLEAEDDPQAEVFVLDDGGPTGTLQVAGRTRRVGELSLKFVRVSGKEGDRSPTSWKVEFSPGRDDVFVGRLWAQCKLEALERTTVTVESPNERRLKIVDLSQEWSLLSSATAFLVLESDEDYPRWGIDRLVRRQYWTPAEALPPIRPALEARGKPRETPRDDGRQEQVARGIARARELLAAGAASQAGNVLQSVREIVPQAAQGDYDQLWQSVQRAARREAVARQSDIYRRWFEPESQWAEPLLPVNVDRLMWTPTSDEFARWHPQAQILLTELELPQARRSLKDLAEWLRSRTSVNVVIDEQAFADLRPVLNDHVLAHGRMCLRSALRHVLRGTDFVLVEEPHRLFFTSSAETESLLPNRVYQIADLLATDAIAEPGRMSDPFADRTETARRRIQEKLQRPVSVRFDETPLSEALNQLADQLDDNVVIDRKSLDDAGVRLNSPVRATWNDVPLANTLEWILKELDLTYIIRDEALIVISKAEAESELEVRLHSGRGVVLQTSSDVQRRQWQGWSGMGGGGFGGGMGGFGGGMGGGGFGGGMGGGGMGGGSLGGGGDPSSSNLGISIVADEAGRGEAPSAEDNPADAPGFDASTRLSAVSVATPLPFTNDSETTIEMLTSTVAPTTWDEVGGPISLEFYEPTLDFVLSATDDVHQEIEVLFNKLRETPIDVRNQADFRHAQPRPADIETLIETITSTVRPTSWDEVGGPASIIEDVGRGALVIAAPADVHDSLWELFVALRRSRYAAQRGERPWEAVSLAGLPRLAGWTPQAFARARNDALPEPKAEELEALKFRREPAGWRQVWEILPGEAPAGQAIELSVRGDRLELSAADRRVRLESDMAAVAYDALALVEYGSWAEAWRQWADLSLPWLPHRSNADLARMFEIEALPPGEQDGQSEPADLARVRLCVPGSGDVACLEIAFDRGAGLPVTCDGFVEGAPVSRMRFAEAAGPEGEPMLTATLEDAKGKIVGRWRLRESGEAGDIPPLTDNWRSSNGGPLAQLDRRSAQTAIEPEFHAALEAMVRYDWREARRNLEASLAREPKQPLLLLLSAWVRDKQPDGQDYERMVAELEQVAASDAVGLTRFIAAGGIGRLSARDRFRILELQRVDLRSAEDWRRLAEAGLAAGQLKPALECALASLRLASSGVDNFAAARLRIELLLRLGQEDGAEQAAVERVEALLAAVAPDAASRRVIQERIADLAALFARFGAKRPADGLLGQLLAQSWLSAESQFELWLQRADIDFERTRRRSLIAGIESLPAEGAANASQLSLRRRGIAILLAELRLPAHYELATQLVEQTRDAGLQNLLRAREAELAPDIQVAADIFWRLFESGRLPLEKADIACHTLVGAQQGERAIAVGESLLRSADAPPDVARQCRFQLVWAYRLAGREVDARRAATVDPEEVDLQPQGPRQSGGGFF